MDNFNMSPINHFRDDFDSSLYYNRINNRKDSVRLVIMIILVAIMSVLIFFKFVLYGTVEVSGPSMQNTLQNGDCLVINKLTKDYKYGDIVVYYRMNYDLKTDKYVHEKTFVDGKVVDLVVIKRIIGLEGDTIIIKDNKVYRIRNGETTELDEPYIKAYSEEEKNGTKNANGTTDEVRFEVGEGEFFAMGDNRAISLDCRYYGAQKTEFILGIVSDFSVKIKDTKWKFIYRFF